MSFLQQANNGRRWHLRQKHSLNSMASVFEGVQNRMLVPRTTVNVFVFTKL